MRIGMICCWLLAAMLLPSTTVSGQSEIETKLQRLQGEAFGYLQGNDATRASEAVAKIIEHCQAKAKDEDSKLKIDESSRFNFLLFAIAIDSKLGNKERAAKTLEGFGKPVAAKRLRAESALLSYKIYGTDGCVPTAIDLLKRSWQLPKNDKAVRDECQASVFEAIIDHFASSEQNAEDVAQQVRDVEMTMVDKGIPIGIARLTRIAIARHLERQGKNDDMEVVLDEIRDVVNNEPLVSDHCRALYWNLVATLHANRHQYFEAFDACRKFEQHAQKSSVDRREQLTAVARDQSALVAIKIGDYGSAKKILASTKRFHGNDLRQLTEWRINMATAMAGGDEIFDARDLLEDSLADKAKMNPALMAKVENNLGLLYYLDGDFDNAEQVMERTLKNTQGVPFAEASVNAGWIALAQNDFAKAQLLFSRAVQLFREQLSEQHPRYAEGLTYLARVAAMTGDAKAKEWIQQAEMLDYRRLCRDLASAGSSRDRIALVQEARVHPESIAWPGAIDTYLELAPKLDISPRQQYEVVLRWKDLTQRFDDRAGTDGGNAEQEAALNAQLDEAYFERPESSLDRQKWQQDLDRLETRLRDLRRSKRNDRQLDPDDLRANVQDVAKTLQGGDLLLDIFQIRTFETPSGQGLLGSAQLYLAFTLAPDGTVHRLDLGRADELDAAIGRWKAAIMDKQFEVDDAQDQNTRQNLENRAGKVAALVQQPILKTGATIRRLLIRPDAATHLIPWAAFPGTDGKRFWIENIRMQICNRVPLDKRFAAAAIAPSLLAVGGVEFCGLKDQLPGTLAEEKLVVKLFRDRFGKAKVAGLTGRAANETSLLRDMPNKKFVHLATHGYYQRRDETNVFEVTGAITMLQSGIVLAPDRGAQGRGAQDRGAPGSQYLTSAEIRETDLSRTSLVVLSACESGLGKVQAGQGVQGMLGSFHAAGASNVIGTLWTIGDETTVPLVQRFYHYLWNKGETPADALHLAQLDMIHTPPEKAGADLLAHPYTWAAFFCSAK